MVGFKVTVVLPQNFQPNWNSANTLWMNPALRFIANTSWVDQAQNLTFTYVPETGSSVVAGRDINGNPVVICAGTAAVGGGFTNASALSSIINSSAWTCLFVYQYR